MFEARGSEESEMAAIAYPFYGAPVTPRRLPTRRPPTRRPSELGVDPAGRHLRLVDGGGRAAVAPQSRPRSRPRSRSRFSTQSRPAVTLRFRQALCAVAGVGALAGIWFGAGAVTGARPVVVVPPPGSVAFHGGYRYVIRPGDTLWSIAAGFEPGADPRPLADALSAQLGGRLPEPGETITLP